MSASGNKNKRVHKQRKRSSSERLSLYLRELETLLEKGVKTVRSQDLQLPGVSTPDQVRRDLANFGQFGKPGVGYQVQTLVAELRKVLGTDRRHSVLLIGVGNLGRALLSYKGFLYRGFDIVAAFDNNPDLIGTEVAGIRIAPLSDLVRSAREKNIKVAILTIPAEELDAVGGYLEEAQIRAVLNLAPAKLDLPEAIVVRNVDLSLQLEQLVFHAGLSRDIETDSG